MWTTSASLRLALLGVLLLAPGLGGAAPPGGSQADVYTSPASKPKKEKCKGEVLFLTRQAITVRDRESTTQVRTFTYSEKVAEKIAKLFDKDQIYQHGDRVEIEYLTGTETAIEISGKPSRPPRP